MMVEMKRKSVKRSNPQLFQFCIYSKNETFFFEGIPLVVLVKNVHKFHRGSTGHFHIVIERVFDHNPMVVSSTCGDLMGVGLKGRSISRGHN